MCYFPHQSYCNHPVGETWRGETIIWKHCTLDLDLLKVIFFLSMNGIHQHLETVLGTSWNLSQPSNKQVQDSPSTFAKDIGNFTAALLHYAGILSSEKRTDIYCWWKTCDKTSWCEYHPISKRISMYLNLMFWVLFMVKSPWGCVSLKNAGMREFFGGYRIPIERVRESKRLIIALGFVFCSLSVEGRLRLAINHSLPTSYCKYDWSSFLVSRKVSFVHEAIFQYTNTIIR